MSIALVRRFVAAFLVAILLISTTASKSGAGSDHRDQSLFPTSWSSYENAEIGISIRYPSSWVIDLSPQKLYQGECDYLT